MGSSSSSSRSSSSSSRSSSSSSGSSSSSSSSSSSVSENIPIFFEQPQTIERLCSVRQTFTFNYRRLKREQPKPRLLSSSDSSCFRRLVFKIFAILTSLDAVQKCIFCATAWLCSSRITSCIRAKQQCKVLSSLIVTNLAS